MLIKWLLALEGTPQQYQQEGWNGEGEEQRAGRLKEPQDIPRPAWPAELGFFTSKIGPLARLLWSLASLGDCTLGALPLGPGKAAFSSCLGVPEHLPRQKWPISASPPSSHLRPLPPLAGSVCHVHPLRLA